MRLTLEQQKPIIEQIRREMTEYFNAEIAIGPIENFCLLWAHFTVKVLHEHGLKTAQLQAGSAYWPILGEKEDDGIRGNQFGYEFAWKPATFSQVIQGTIPEMHAWVGIADHPMEIIDITAPFFKKRAISVGFQYSAPEPPEFLWADIKNMPKHVYYKPDIQAIEIAMAFLSHTFNNTPLMIRKLKEYQK